MILKSKYKTNKNILILLNEIKQIAKSNPGGYVDEPDESDNSPEDTTVLYASMIVKRCNMVIGLLGE
jgi:hypothetical protein